MQAAHNETLIRSLLSHSFTHSSFPHRRTQRPSKLFLGARHAEEVPRYHNPQMRIVQHEVAEKHRLDHTTHSSQYSRNFRAGRAGRQQLLECHTPRRLWPSPLQSTCAPALRISSLRSRMIHQARQLCNKSLAEMPLHLKCTCTMDGRLQLSPLVAIPQKWLLANPLGYLEPLPRTSESQDSKLRSSPTNITPNSAIIYCNRTISNSQN